MRVVRNMNLAEFAQLFADANGNLPTGEYDITVDGTGGALVARYVPYNHGALVP